MGIFDRLRDKLANDETLERLREIEAKASSALVSGAKRAAATTREVAERFVEPEVLDELEARARAADAALRHEERAVFERVAETASRVTGVEVTTESAMRVGRTVLTAAVAAGVADAAGAADTTPEAATPEAVTPEAAPTEAGSGEAPTVLYDGMGNMDGTTTISDGGVALDS